MKLLNYIKKIINSESKESSKRLIALFTMLLIAYVVIVFTNWGNAVYMVGTLCGFVLALAGVSTWENTKLK